MKRKIIPLLLAATTLFVVSLPIYISGAQQQSEDLSIIKSMAINSDNFPDASFASLLRQGAYDKDQNGILSVEEIEGIKLIDASGVRVADYAGIEYLVNLEILYCTNNTYLRKLDLSKNSKLKELYCSNTQLTSLDVSHNLELQILYCGSNKLTSINIANNQKLRELSYSDNLITTLDVSMLPNLELLSCNKNQLISLKLGNANLRELYCANNILTELDTRLLSNLEVLSIGENQVSQLDLSENKKLTNLQAFDNLLTELDLSKNKELKELSLNRNKIGRVDLQYNLKLESLSIKENQLTDVKLNQNVGLKFLNCSGNQLADLNVSELIRLEDLVCDNNQLTNLVLPNNSKLKKMRIQNNQLKNVDLEGHEDLTLLISYNMDGTEPPKQIVKEENKQKVLLADQGVLDTVYASWFKQEDGEADDTQAIQRAIDSQADVIIIDNIGRNWSVAPLFIKNKSGKTIILEDQVVLEAQKGKYPKKDDSLLTINSSNGIIIKGNGNTLLVMRKEEDTANKIERFEEWRHGIAMAQNNDVLIENIHIQETGGDGVAISANVVVQNNIQLQGVHVDRAYRNGLSIGGGKDVLVKDCSFDNTKGTLPLVGVDIEAHGRSIVFDNIRLENCEMSGNTVGGLAVALGTLTDAPEVFLSFDGLKISNHTGIGAAIQLPSSHKAGGYVSLNNLEIRNTEAFHSQLNIIQSNYFVDVSNATLEGNKNQDTTIFLMDQKARYEGGNTTLQNIRIISNSNNKERMFWPYSKLPNIKVGTKVTPPSYIGEIAVEKENGEIWSFNVGEVTSLHAQEDTMREESKPIVNMISLTDTMDQMSLNTSYRFKGSIEGSGEISQRINWCIRGNQSPNTIIDARGFLYIAEDETADRIQVIGSSISAPDKTVEHTVVIGK